jgi:hypothetical protein
MRAPCCIASAALVWLAFAPGLHAQPADSAWLATKGFFLRADGAVVHLAPRALREGGARPLRRILGDVPGIQVRARGEREVEFWLEPEAGPAADACRLDLYVNGGRIQLRLREQNVAIDQLIRPADLTAIEVFRAAEAPAGDPDGCGAVLVWSHATRHLFDDDFTGTLRGLVQFTNSEGVPGADVRLEPGGHRTVTDASGRFSIERLAPAVYQVVVTSREGVAASMEYMVRAHAVTELILELHLQPPRAGEGRRWFTGVRQCLHPRFAGRSLAGLPLTHERAEECSEPARAELPHRAATSGHGVEARSLGQGY